MLLFPFGSRQKNMRNPLFFQRSHGTGWMWYRRRDERGADEWHSKETHSAGCKDSRWLVSFFGSAAALQHFFISHCAVDIFGGVYIQLCIYTQTDHFALSHAPAKYFVWKYFVYNLEIFCSHRIYTGNSIISLPWNLCFPPFAGPFAGK